MKHLIIAFVVLCSTLATAQTTDDRGYLVKVGDQAPNFTIKLTFGKTIQLKDLLGKVVMLQFTASWCSVCRKEMPFIESDIWLKNKANPSFALVAIDRDEPMETVLKFVESTKITYPIGLDPNADIFALYAQREAGITRNVIIDKTGKIVLLTRLYNENEFALMKAKIEEMLQ
ncbi:MAG: TlpA family protein disulfide reductase [Paludibacter sp.]